MLLDLLGVSKETRRKVKFRNMQTDSMHSFFGGYCDCFVSDDAGILKKVKRYISSLILKLKYIQ